VSKGNDRQGLRAAPEDGFRATPGVRAADAREVRQAGPPTTTRRETTVNKAQLHVLTDAEALLVLETEKSALAALDEDALVELHTRIRRARGKYVGQYRRGAAARVQGVGGRGKANPQNQRARDKAEIFEDALSRVSSALAAAAKASAAALKTERLDAARAAKANPRAAAPASSSGKASSGKASAASASRAKTGTPSPASKKKNASTLATGARRQTKRDSR